jgi:uncharacterized membrane protein HdeD (DUF308 family)
METKQRPWWLLLIGGILAVIVGAILLFSGPVDAARTWVVLIQVLGIWWLISGIFDIVYMFRPHLWARAFIGISASWRALTSCGIHLHPPLPCRGFWCWCSASGA